MWKRHKEIFGEYKLESASAIHGKPHYISIFDSGNHGIWYDVNGRLTIGLSSKIGTTDAIAYVEPHKLDDDSCPYDPAYEWSYKKRKKFLEAGVGLTIKSIGY